MKHRGSVFEYSRERDADLLSTYYRYVGFFGANELYRRIVESPARRFYVSPERAYAVVLRILRGSDLSRMRPERREMFFEIARRVDDARVRYPQSSLAAIIERVVEQPAPKFYLTPKSAITIIHYIRKR